MEDPGPAHQVAEMVADAVDEQEAAISAAVVGDFEEGDVYTPSPDREQQAGRLNAALQGTRAC